MATYLVGDEAIKAMLNRIAQATGGSGLKPVFNDIGETLVSNIQLGFKDQQDPWGNRWKQLSPVTIARRRKGKGVGNPEILRDTGKLRSSINHQATAKSVLVGTSDTLGKALMHQFGGYSKLFKANVPARPFLPIRNNKADLPNDWQMDVLDVLRHHLEQAVKKS